jgi:4-oxalocrotonate tautomerase
MPMIHVELFPGRTPDQLESLAEAITDAAVKTCDARAEDVWVIITEVARDRWAHQGRMYSRSGEGARDALADLG